MYSFTKHRFTISLNSSTKQSKTTYMKKIMLPLLVAFVFMAGMQDLQAQILTFNFATIATGTGSTAVLTNTTALDANLTLTTGLSLGTVTSTTTASRFSTTGYYPSITSLAAAITGNKYIYFKITAKAGYTLNLAGKTVVFTVQSSGTGITDCALMTSIDGFSSSSPVTIGTSGLSGTNPSTTLQSTTKTGLIYTFGAGSQYNNITSTVEFRFYAYNASASTGTFSLNAFSLNGTVSSAALTPPSLTAASSPTVDAPFNVTFTDNSAWRSAITGVTVGGTTLTAGYSVSAGQIAFTPSASSPAALLQTSGSLAISIAATGYSAATVTQSLGAGAANKLGITTQPAAPATNGTVLATQPVVVIQDQYGNATTSTATVAAGIGAGSWTIGGTTSKIAVGGSATFTDLTASSGSAVNGATISFSSGGLTGATSGTFNIPAPVLTPTLNAVTLASPLSNTYGTASTGVSFSAAGTNLSNPITVTPNAGWEISTTSASAGFQGSGTAISGLSTSGATVYIRNTATLAVTNYNSTICAVVSSTGASPVNVTTSAASNTITAASVTITGISISNKPYDGTTTATITGTAGYSGLVNGESFAVSGSPSAAFTSSAVGTGVSVTVSGYSAPSANYIITQPTGLTANITAATYYWNGGTTTGTGITAAGGTGIWNTTNTNWVSGSPGNAIAWPNSANYNAVIGGTGTGNTITVSNSTTGLAANQVEFSATGYTVIGGGSFYPIGQPATPTTVILDASKNVNFFTAATNTAQSLIIDGNLSGAASSSVTLQGSPQFVLGGTVTYSCFEFGVGGSTIDVPNINIAAGSGLTGGNTAYGAIGISYYVNNVGTPNTCTISVGTTITNNNASGTYPLNIGANYTNSTLIVNGKISGTGDVQIATNFSSGYGTTKLNNSGNNYQGNTYLNGTTSSSVFNTLQLGNSTALPSTTSVIFGNPASKTACGGILDLYGLSPTIAGLSSTTSFASGGSLLSGSKITNSSATPSTLTVTIPSGTNTLAAPINNGTGTVALTLNGAGTFVLSSASSFSGGLSVSGGGKFQAGVATVFSGSPALTLNNGVYSTGSSAGNTATLGTLTVGSGNGTISLGTGVHTLTFANSSSLSWTGNLTISNWTGNGYSGATAGKIMVGAGGLSVNELSRITFTGFSGTPTISGTGELVPAYTAPSISVQPSTATPTVCSNAVSAISITATAGTASISYQWYYNSTASTSGAISVGSGSGGQTNTYTPNQTGAYYYYCVVTDVYGNTVNSGFSGLITINASGAPTVFISPSPSYTTCAASTANIDFSIAGTTLSGTSPSYAWYKNGSQVATGSTYSPLPSEFSDGDNVYVIMTSNYACATQSTAQSTNTTLTITAALIPAVTISNSITSTVSTTVSICTGTSITFTADPTNGGTDPTYQWYNGSTPVGTASTYTSSSFSNNDHITVVVTSNDVCASPTTGTSAITTVTVNPLLTPTVSVTASANPVCTGTSVTFSATPTNGGTSPTYAWYKNSLVVAGQTAATYTLASPANSDAVYAILTAGSDMC